MARILVPEDLLRELGRCGSCGGSGNYVNKGWHPKTYNGPGKVVSVGAKTGALFVEETVLCRKCDGTGYDPRVWSLLIYGEAEATNG